MIKCLTGESITLNRLDLSLARCMLSIVACESLGDGGKGLERNPSITARKLSIELSMREMPSDTAGTDVCRSC